jgi:adenylate cyclase
MSQVLGMRIGIAAGEVVVGNIGSDVTKSYTLIGDTVKVGSRLEGANKAYGTRILVSRHTAEMAAGSMEFREIDRILVKGRSEPERVFELLGRKNEIDEPFVQLRGAFEAGLEAYRACRWAEAAGLFGQCLEQRPDDPPSRIFLERVEQLQQKPPADGWDGVWQLTEK